VGFEEIEVVISPDGEVSIEVKGVSGQLCLARTADLENALGGQLIKRDMKAEAYQQAQQQVPKWQQQSR
jgi:hypothetical protein